MVVIIGAGPLTLRSGRKDSRSISTPKPPDSSMVTTSAAEHHAQQRQPGHDHPLAVNAHELQRPHADEAADHEDVEVREVDQLQDAVDQGEPEGEQ